MMISTILSLVWWISTSLITYFWLQFGLTFLWRYYKIVWRGRRNKKPINGRDAVLITGATSGIGLALAKHLYAAGFSVIVGYYNSEEAGLEELKLLSKDKKRRNDNGQRMSFVEVDVRKQNSISDAYTFCSSELALHKLKLCALINNAGLGSLQPFCWLQRQRIKNIIDTNLTGSMLMTREFIPLLAQSPNSRVINVSSGLGLVPGKTYLTYGVTKSALIYFSRCLDLELKSKYNIRTIAMIPHNYIKNTNICSLNVKNNEDAWSEMKPIERQLYETEFKEHCNLTVSLEKATKKHNQLASAKKVNPDNDICSNKLLNRLLKLLKPLRDCIRQLEGKNEALTLEQSGVLECFEDAIRLEDPPEYMFAGDNVYNLFIGSLLLCIPISCNSLLSSAVSPSLYK